MTWFKVDDGFYDHPKVSELSNAAIGLWTKAGSFCSKHLTDGVISAQQVRMLKGTPAQVRALIDAGLWGETTTELGAKAYSFLNWFDYQPTRNSVEDSRQQWREKKRKSRERKDAKQRKGENVPGGVPEMSPEGTNGGVPEMSGSIPVPSRPDPSSSGTGSQPPYGGNVREEVAGGEITMDALAAATRRARAAGVSETAIQAGTREFTNRNGDKGPGLLRILIDEAAAREARTAPLNAAKSARRAAIDACDMCDENGIAYDGGVARRCTHTTTKPEPPF